MNSNIKITGVKEHNLKNINITIPRDKLVVLTGISGSGKSTLAFDTIFAEGQRRYVESLSSYARQFLGQMQKPDIESIEGLSPTIAIDQKTTSHNPRSTVGTVTEIYDYLRLLYSRIGVAHCVNCGKEITRQSIDQICDRVMALGEGKKIMVIAPVVRGRKGEYNKMLEGFLKSGYARVKIDGNIYSLQEEIKIDKNIKHDISVVIDRLVIKEDIQKRLVDSVENAIKLADGLVVIDCEDEEILFSNKYACTDCNISIEEVEPRLFSFNSPYGACPNCLGLGFKNEVDIDFLLRNSHLSINEGALNIMGWMENGKISEMWNTGLSKHYGFSLDVPVRELSQDVMKIMLYGTSENIELQYGGRKYSSTFEGLVNIIKRRYNESSSEYSKRELSKFMVEQPCEVCNGKRLKPEPLAVTIDGKNIAEFCGLSIKNELKFIESLQLNTSEEIIAKPIIKEIKARLNFLINVGLNYLSLSRSATTLSGGEAQRIRLATQIGSGLMGVLYILDEPSIGLHQRDNEKLLNTLVKLRDIGNTLLVVEHDEDTMRMADHIIDIGPYAGVNGGYVVAEGSVEDIIAQPDSITGAYLSGKSKIEVPKKRRAITDRCLRIVGAKQNNLKNITVDIPLGVFTTITGVSGSGKSSLINEILYPELAKRLNNAKVLKTGVVDDILGIENVDKVINIDQSPIGRTPRSNPATYTGVFSNIRELFASTVDAKQSGYKAGRFSFNVKGGRCESCQGDGIVRIEMYFLPDVYVPCEVCKGKRYNRETLNVKYKGKSIYDVLEMTVNQACEFFENIPSIYNKIKTLQDVGLGYIKLGQSATTLSGGEAQRVKLATELAKRQTGKTVYILDEPTTGLHMYDVHKLIGILQKLADSGNTIIVIEHNLDVIKVSDYVIDLGKEGGDEGGEILAIGTPEQISQNPQSYTGYYLQKLLY